MSEFDKRPDVYKLYCDAFAEIYPGVQLEVSQEALKLMASRIREAKPEAVPSHADAPEVSAQGASEGKESADVRCASSPSATAASAPERPAFTPEAWAAAEWAIPLHMHPYDWNVAECPGDYKAPTPGQVRGYIAQAVHRHQQQVEQPSIDRLKRELTEWKIKAKTWQQIADQRAIEAADLKVAAAISAGPCTETALCRLGWIVRDNEIARLKAELAKATAAKAIVAHDSGRNI